MSLALSSTLYGKYATKQRRNLPISTNKSLYRNSLNLWQHRDQQTPFPQHDIKQKAANKHRSAT